MARIDPNDPRPPYQQIANDLRRRIEAGEFAPGARLPSSRDLAADYGVAPMTVHQGLRVLRDEGMVNSFQGRGVFVRTDREPPQMDLSAQVNDIRERLQELDVRVPPGLVSDLDTLRRQVGVLQARLIDLYARTGNPYPHDQAERAATAGRRKASGA